MKEFRCVTDFMRIFTNEAILVSFSSKSSWLLVCERLCFSSRFFFFFLNFSCTLHSHSHITYPLHRPKNKAGLRKRRRHNHLSHSIERHTWRKTVPYVCCVMLDCSKMALRLDAGNFPRFKLSMALLILK